MTHQFPFIVTTSNVPLPPPSLANRRTVVITTSKADYARRAAENALEKLRQIGMDDVAYARAIASLVLGIAPEDVLCQAIDEAMGNNAEGAKWIAAIRAAGLAVP